MLITLIIVGALGAFLLQGIRRIPASPPHKGQATRWGKRIPGKVYNEGWGFFPLFPYWFGFVLIKVERITFEITSEKTRTPDRAETKIPVFLTIRPIGESTPSQPSLLIEYLNSGGEDGVKSQLKGKIQERVREWASGPEEGPANWIELNQSHLEAVSVLVKQIAGNSVTVIPLYAQAVPTWIWLRYFAQPQPKKFLQNEKKWAKNNWKQVKDVLDSIKNNPGLGPNAITQLETAVRGRRKNIEDLRTGTGNIVLKDLGVVLERLNLGDMDVLGEVGKKAEDEAREVQEREGEIVELNHFIQRVKALMIRQPEGPGLTREQALEQVQLSLGKATKAIDAKTIAFDQPTAEIIAAILGRKT